MCEQINTHHNSTKWNADAEKKNRRKFNGFVLYQKIIVDEMSIFHFSENFIGLPNDKR